MTSPVIGLPWYARESYARLREQMADGAALPADYDVWRQSAEQNETVGRASGLAIVRVPIEPEPFAEWCRAKGLSPDGRARQQFAREEATRA
ncbi:MAG TPA: hypothetical protein VIL09_02205 [Microvirga sp.]